MKTHPPPPFNLSTWNKSHTISQWKPQALNLLSIVVQSMKSIASINFAFWFFTLPYLLSICSQKVLTISPWLRKMNTMVPANIWLRYCGRRSYIIERSMNLKNKLQVINRFVFNWPAMTGKSMQAYAQSFQCRCFVTVKNKMVRHLKNV